MVDTRTPSLQTVTTTVKKKTKNKRQALFFLLTREKIPVTVLRLLTCESVGKPAGCRCGWSEAWAEMHTGSRGRPRCPRRSRPDGTGSLTEGRGVGDQDQQPPHNQSCSASDSDLSRTPGCRPTRSRSSSSNRCWSGCAAGSTRSPRPGWPPR